MKVSDINKLTEKAKNKKDGVYDYNGFVWAVKAGRFVAFANYYGECFERMGSFNVQIGVVERYDRKKELRKWLKNQN